jgi:hypothetical protein
MIGLVNETCFAQISLTGRRFMFQDMTAERFTAFELTGAGYFEAFSRASAGFHLRHNK